MECYTEYVNRVLRFYARNPVPNLCTLADKLNWQAADKVLLELGAEQRNAVFFVFKSKGRMSESVANCGLPPHVAWRIIANVSRAIAQERGLI